jgi:hypothetical protein
MSKPKPSTISRDPYAQDPYAFIGTPAKQEERPAPVTSTPVKKAATEKITIPFPEDLIERARNAAYWDRLTLAGIVVQALTEVLDRMEQERGKPYPPRTTDLRGGRPVGTGKTSKARNA